MNPVYELAMILVEQHAAIAERDKQLKELTEQLAALKVQLASEEEWKLERDRLTERNNELEAFLRERQEVNGTEFAEAR